MKNRMMKRMAAMMAAAVLVTSLGDVTVANAAVNKNATVSSTEVENTEVESTESTEAVVEEVTATEVASAEEIVITETEEIATTETVPEKTTSAEKATEKEAVVETEEIAEVEADSEAASTGANIALKLNTTNRYTAPENEKVTYTFTTDSTDSYYILTTANLGTFGVFAEDGESEDDAIQYYYYYAAVGTLYMQDHTDRKGLFNLGKLTKNHTYYLVAHYGAGTTYRVTVNQYKDDLGDTSETAKNFNIGTSGVSGSIDNRKDVDYYRFTTGSDDAFYNITMRNISDAPEGTLGFTIYSTADCLNEDVINQYNGYTPDKAEVGLRAKTSETLDLYKLEKNHTYYVAVSSSIDDPTKGKFTMSVTKVIDDVKDTVDQAMKLTLNKSYSKTLQNKNDVDVFSFKTSALRNYTLNFANLDSDGRVGFTVYSGKDMTDNQRVYSCNLAKKETTPANEKNMKLAANRTYYVVINGSVGKYRIGVNATSPSGAKVAKANTATKKKVKISWKKVTKATGYEVYRATSSKGKYSKLKTVKGNAKVSYTDSKKLKKGKTYYYKVRAYVTVKGKKYYSAYSSTKKIKIK